jgi:hypothetical protein
MGRTHHDSPYRSANKNPRREPEERRREYRHGRWTEPKDLDDIDLEDEVGVVEDSEDDLEEA